MDEKENFLFERKLFELSELAGSGGGCMNTVGVMSAVNSLASFNSQQQQQQPQQNALSIKQEHDDDGGGDIVTSSEHFLISDQNIKSEVKLEDVVEESEPEVDIHISNVVCNFNTRCHLNLRKVALNGSNVVYRREQGMISMRIRNPHVTASIWSSGKITLTGATSEESGKRGCRKVARILQKMGFRVKFTDFRVVNVLGTVILPFGIKISQFTEQYRSVCSYEPELHPGATYRFPEVRAVMKIFQTGAITITAPSVNKVQLAVEHIYPLVYDFKKEKPVSSSATTTGAAATKNSDNLLNKRKRNNNTSNGKENSRKRLKFIVSSDEEEDEEEVDIDEDEEAILTDEDDDEDDEELELSD